MKEAENYKEELLRTGITFICIRSLGLEEKETSAYIKSYLEKLGYEITPVFPTGMIAELPELKKGKNCGGKGRNGRPSYGRKDRASICLCESGAYACLRT